MYNILAFKVHFTDKCNWMADKLLVNTFEKGCKNDALLPSKKSFAQQMGQLVCRRFKEKIKKISFSRDLVALSLRKAIMSQIAIV